MKNIELKMKIFEVGRLQNGQSCIGLGDGALQFHVPAPITDVMRAAQRLFKPIKLVIDFDVDVDEEPVEKFPHGFDASVEAEYVKRLEEKFDALEAENSALKHQLADLEAACKKVSAMEDKALADATLLNKAIANTGLVVEFDDSGKPKLERVVEELQPGDVEKGAGVMATCDVARTGDHNSLIRGRVYIVTGVNGRKVRANGEWWDIKYFTRPHDANDDGVAEVSIEDVMEASFKVAHVYSAWIEQGQDEPEGHIAFLKEQAKKRLAAESVLVGAEKLAFDEHTREQLAKWLHNHVDHGDGGYWRVENFCELLNGRPPRYNEYGFAIDKEE